jgi:hypothetical protein
MLERPDAANLLDTARDVLLRDLLPHLPEAQRFHARMVANAMAIARREAAADTAPALAALHAATGTTDDPLPRLAQQIRAGTHDPGTPAHDAVAAALRELTRLRCGVSAPKAIRS